MPLPTGLEYFKVTWNALAGITDTDDPDEEPDIVPLTGQVVFTPSRSDVTLMTGPTGTYFLEPVVGDIANGVLVNANGNPILSLISPFSSGLRETGWHWTVSFKFAGKAKAPFPLQGQPGQTYNLAFLEPVAITPEQITVGIPGPAGEEGPVGPTGPGVPAGGALEQVIAHTGSTTEWQYRTRRYPISPGSSSGQRRYMRLCTVDGGTATGGANVDFILSGTGDYGDVDRGTVFVHVGQRGSNGIMLKAWGLDVENTADPIELYTRQVSEFVFEVWALLSDFNLSHDVHILNRASAGSGVTTMNFDSAGTVAPSGLSAAVPISSISSAVAQVLAAVAAATPNTFIKRDAEGQAQVAAPTDPADIATKAYVDSVGTPASVPNSTMRRDADGNTLIDTISITDAPSSAEHGTRKDYVDGQVATRAGRQLTKRTITGNYTLVAADVNDMLMHSTVNSPTAGPVITLPADSAATIGQEISIPWRQYGTAQMSFAAGAGATLLARGGSTVNKAAGQNAEGYVTKVAPNTWLLSGDITA